MLATQIKHDERERLLLPKALPSLGVVPKEFPPFRSPHLVNTVGSGSKATLQVIPPGISNSYIVSFKLLKILLSKGADTP